ncbi:MAG: threonine synthase, partial [Lentisphaeria bacterium]
GEATAVDASVALLNGIGSDGGLYVPEVWPTLSKESWEGKDYLEILEAILGVFFPDFNQEVIQSALLAVTKSFSMEEVLPIVEHGGIKYLELFHGETGAFKDVALSVLPVLLKEASRDSGYKKIAILAATSGDTGSAAMAGFNGVEGTEVLVFYPKVGTSEVQRRQMVCQAGSNIHACAIDGNFDVAQQVVKDLFNNEELKERAKEAGVKLSSANSINIGRLFPQISYYFHIASKLKCEFDITVPTGNFGNILAGYYAKKLGCPIGKLIVASNENQVVADFIKTGKYDARRNFKVTNTPSMDILVSSNLERLLYDLVGAAEVKKLMKELQNSGEWSLSSEKFAKLQENFISGVSDEEETLATIKEVWEKDNYLIDPHTAVAVKVAKEKMRNCVPMVVAATASPWKFATTMVKAIKAEVLHDEFANLLYLESLTDKYARFKELLSARVVHLQSCTRTTAEVMVRNTFKIWENSDEI